MLRVQVVAAQQEGGELLRRGHGPRHAAGVDLPALNLVEHRDMDVFIKFEGGATRLNLLPHEVATAHDPPGDQAFQRGFDVLCRESVSLPEFFGGQWTASAQDTEENALEP